MFSHRCFNFNDVSAASSSHWLNSISSRVPMRWWVCAWVDNIKNWIEKSLQFHLNIDFYLIEFINGYKYSFSFAHICSIFITMQSDFDSSPESILVGLRAWFISICQHDFSLVFLLNGKHVVSIFDAISDYSRSNCIVSYSFLFWYLSV